jgi:hypothetical protein
MVAVTLQTTVYVGRNVTEADKLLLHVWVCVVSGGKVWECILFRADMLLAPVQQ